MTNGIISTHIPNYNNDIRISSNAAFGTNNFENIIENITQDVSQEIASEEEAQKINSNMFSNLGAPPGFWIVNDAGGNEIA